MPECAKCEVAYHLEDDHEDDKLCHDCAHLIANAKGGCFLLEEAQARLLVECATRQVEEFEELNLPASLIDLVWEAINALDGQFELLEEKE